MPVAATGIYRDLDLFRELIAASTTFQSVTNTANATEAKKRTHGYAAVDDIHPLPRAIVAPEEWTRSSESRNMFSGITRLRVSFEFVVPEGVAAEDSFDDQLNWFMNKIGAIWSEMEALDGTGEPATGLAHCSMRSHAIAAGPQFEKPGSKRDLEDLDAGKMPRLVWWISHIVELY